jgi:hypothetical protein
MFPPDVDDHLQNLIRWGRFTQPQRTSSFRPEPQQCDLAVPSIFFSLHPFADIGSAILKLHAIRFATYKKPHYVAIDYGNVFQIENDVAAVRLKFKKPPQFGYRRAFDSAT